MKYGWNVDSDFSFGSLSREFHYANLLVDEIMAENLSNVKRLLQINNANVNTVIPELGVAPLHLLAGLENEDFSSVVMLEALLRCGGDPNVRSEEGLTPVHVAAMWGRCRVLDILLANGGDPDLLDYKLNLNAEDYAIKERQWQIYGALSTFSVISESGSTENKEDTDSKYLENNDFFDDTVDNRDLKRLSTDHRSDIKTGYTPNNEYAVNNEYAIVRKSKDRKNKQHRTRLLEESPKNTDDETYSKISDNSRRGFRRKYKIFSKKYRQPDDDYKGNTIECNRKSIGSLKLNDHAIRTIRDHRRKTHIYESISSDNLSSISQHTPRDKHRKLHLYGDSVSENCDWIRRTDESVFLNKKAIDTIKKQRLNSKIYQTKGLGEDPRKGREKRPPLYEESEVCDWVDCKTDKNMILDDLSLNKIKDYRMNSKMYQNCSPRDCSTIITPNKSKNYRNSEKNKIRNNSEESEMYFCGYAEQSLKPRGRSRRSSRFTHSSRCSEMTHSTDFEEGSIPNHRMLCKMSRMFLFMLKKRHIYQKIK